MVCWSHRARVRRVWHAQRNLQAKLRIVHRPVSSRLKCIFAAWGLNASVATAM